LAQISPPEAPSASSRASGSRRNARRGSAPTTARLPISLVKPCRKALIRVLPAPRARLHLCLKDLRCSVAP
jgi:hypothetical protein